VLRELLTYTRIKVPGRLRRDYLWPAAFSLLLTAVLAIPTSLAVFPGLSLLAELVRVVTELLQLLAGFYIALLALVSTMSSTQLNELMSKVELKVGDDWQTLSRRRYLAFLFGYLAFVCVSLYLVSSGSLIVADEVATVLGGLGLFMGWVLPVIGWTLFAVFTFAALHMFTITANGIRYLSFRLHIPEIKQGPVEIVSDSDNA